MTEIFVMEVERDTFRVVVEDGASSTQHHVVVSPDDLAGLPEVERIADLVEASFRFLLDREPKESILSRFELGVISRYFPEYREEIGDYL